MSAFPSEEEIWGAIGKLKSGKAGGDSGILPEMVKAARCEKGFFCLLMDLMHAAWCECRVPKEWSDAVLVPIPKKGNLGKHNNYGGYLHWMLWRQLLQESSRSSCRNWLKMCCLSHNVGSGRPEDILT